MKYIVTIFFLLFVSKISAQTVYKTPSGKKYHTATCRYVKNVSNGMTVNEALRIGLEPCTQCNPNNSSANRLVNTTNSRGLGIRSNEAQGTLQVAVQCKGKTKAGARCKRKTKNKNGYCFQHETK
ncbi:DUF5763 domain-containing protein [Sphingobacterium kyonggiense]